jgi:protein-S-isoprenylcysteine O-methyltransferase Ste14
MIKSKLVQTLYDLRVRIGPLLVIGVFLAARSTWRSLALGLGVAAIGLAIRAWAAGHIQKEKKLAVSGPYRYTRNPLYVGNFVLGIGIAAATNTWWGTGLFLLYFGLFYPPVIIEERERMRRLFPAEYADYTASVPLLLPRLRPAAENGEGRFRWALYRKNREPRALLGTLFVWALLVAKTLLIR